MQRYSRRVYIGKFCSLQSRAQILKTWNTKLLYWCVLYQVGISDWVVLIWLLIIVSYFLHMKTRSRDTATLPKFRMCSCYLIFSFLVHEKEKWMVWCKRTLLISIEYALHMCAFNNFFFLFQVYKTTGIFKNIQQKLCKHIDKDIGNVKQLCKF